MGNSKRQSSLSNQQGQAVVEYVLMLVVSVAMVLAVAYQVFRPLQTYLQDYMGSYIACLLETGELPSLGNESTQEILAAEGCNAKFKAATARNGRPPVDSSSNSSGSTDDAKNSNSKNSSSDSSSSSGGGSSSSASGSNGRNLLNRPRAGGGGADGPAANDKVTEIPADIAQSKYYNRRTNSDRNGIDPNKKFAIGGAMFSEEEKRKQGKKEASNQSIALPDGSGSAPKKISVKPPVREIASDDNIEGMTFGNFFRILMIAAIIIALFVVLGSQALKIVKSQEK